MAQATKDNHDLQSYVNELERRIALQEERERSQQAAAGPADNQQYARELEKKVAKLEAEMKEEKARYESLEEEQEELLIALAKIEIENNNLKEKLIQIEGVPQ